MMKNKIVRVCAWFTMIFFSLTSVVLLIMIFTENSKQIPIITFLIIIGMAITGLNTRNYGLSGFKLNRFSKPLALFSLLAGILFAILAPIIFTSSFGLNESFNAIITLLIMFLPVIISSIALITSKSRGFAKTENL